jgi:hypothetical protein
MPTLYHPVGLHFSKNSKEQIMWHMCGEMQGKPTQVNLIQMDMAGKSEVTD